MPKRDQESDQPEADYGLVSIASLAGAISRYNSRNPLTVQRYEQRDESREWPQKAQKGTKR